MLSSIYTNCFITKICYSICSLVVAQQTEDSQQTASRISTASKNSTKDDFVTKFQLRNVAELLDVGQVKTILQTTFFVFFGYNNCSI